MLPRFLKVFLNIYMKCLLQVDGTELVFMINFNFMIIKLL